jgi:hypothetical protein
MDKSKLQIESLILVAIAKHFNSQGTYLIGELKAQTKFNFNVAMNATNNFVKGIEVNLNPDEVKFLDDLIGAMDDAMSEMRKELEKQNINQ